MKLDFAKNTTRNVLAVLIARGAEVAIPFFRKTLFMWVLGPGYLGLNGLFYSILGMLSLAEMGFGTAIICYMYKPVANDDREQLCAYLRFYRSVYRWVGSLIFTVGLCLLPFLRKLIHGDIPPGINLHLLYFLQLLNTSLSYFLFVYRGSILGAHHRNDVANYIRTILTICEFGTVALILPLTHNYYHYVFITLGFTMLTNLCIVFATKRLFPDITPRGKLPKEEVKHILSNVNAIFMHKVGAIINNSFDNIVISSFIGLVAVGSYNNYHCISLAIGKVTSSVCNSLLAGFGNKIYTESKEQNFQLLMKTNGLLMCAILWCTAMLLSLYQPFMVLWIKGDALLLRHFLTPVLMVVWFFEKQSREPLRMFKNAAAIWQQDKWKAVIAAVANLAMNITFIMVFPEEYKLDGVILSTILSDVIIQIPWESFAVFSTFFGKSEAVRYWRQQGFYLLLGTLLAIGTWYATLHIPLDGFPGLFAKAAFAAILSGAVLLLFFRKDLATLVNTLFHKKGNPT